MIMHSHTRKYGEKLLAVQQGSISVLISIRQKKLSSSRTV